MGQNHHGHSKKIDFIPWKKIIFGMWWNIMKVTDELEEFNVDINCLIKSTLKDGSIYKILA